MNFDIVSFLNDAIRIGIIFLLGCVGEIITEKSGHLNLGIPGVMFVGTATGCAVESVIVNMAGNPATGRLEMTPFLTVCAIVLPMLATWIAGAMMGLIYSFFTVTLRANQNVTGLILNIFGEGVCYFILNLVSENTFSYALANDYFRAPLPFASKLGWFGKLFLSYGFLVYLAIAIAIVTSFVLNRTRVGLHLRAVGENPATADAAGINVTAYRYGATCIGCAIAAFGGFFAVMDFFCGSWSYSLDSFGWLSIALVIFTLWKPILSIFGSILFGILYMLSSAFNVPLAVQSLFEMIPYLVTILVLVFTSIRNRRENQAPAALGLSYFREER